MFGHEWLIRECWVSRGARGAWRNRLEAAHSWSCSITDCRAGLMRTLLRPLPLPAGCHIRVPSRNLIISTTAAFRMDATSGPAMPSCHPATLLPPAFILATKEPKKWLLLLPSWEGRIHSVYVGVGVGVCGGPVTPGRCGRGAKQTDKLTAAFYTSIS